jgi:DNA polymerase-4
LRWSDFTTLTRQTTLSQTTNDFSVISGTAAELFDQVWEEGQMVRLIGVGVHNLDTGAHQLGLWDTETQKDLKIQETLQELQEKYGENVISRGPNN